ncbi:PQQ-dependent sugar dehydrogenase [Bosea sp. (in: a-proteobacteria)]|uniref:PQQ-dependent sugar dehydrogenase n=1 Tax=Bosea sp. (in: a-proteobacteria) TaxID=1871050 RepID=UPI002604589C|nr:PQQ-dependent sugar dehydrogenase [Bosea sp. (in: a-proteobacteria)]MCO5091156.1 PQQ-dependent sugar dehydrogenase [Bosea sp. (in: a-proteobacteria)]
MLRWRWAGLLGMVLALAGAALPAAAQKRFPSSAGALAVETVASGLTHPWGLAFLPDGRMLVSERPGRLRIVGADGALSRPIAGVPAVVARGQGGLLGLALDPAFAQNRLVYFSFSEPRQGGNGTSVARGRLDEEGTALSGVETIFRQMPAVDSNMHFGSRLVFDRTGALFVTLGDRFSQRAEAQNPANHIGKVVRIRPDGTLPADNPRKQGWAPEVWSIGHRNVQGAALHPESGQLWTAEHAARGGDEINTPRAGLNYGWPVITYGVDYSGAKIGEGTAKPGMEQPLFYWDPSIAPSGAAFYTGPAWPAWKNSLFVGALAGKMLVRLSTEGGKVTGEERLLTDLGLRIRDVVQGPDGFLYLVSDEDDGKILRVRPAG